MSTDRSDAGITKRVAWTTPEMQAHLQEELTAIIDLQGSPRIKTEEGREIVARLRRLEEILVHGRATTPMPTRHHQ